MRTETGSLLVETQIKQQVRPPSNLFLVEFGYDYGIFPRSEAYRLETSVQVAILESDKKVLPQRVSVAESP